jgi:hypothetical protein
MTDSLIFEKALKSGTDRMLSAMGSYNIWKWIETGVNINKDGKESADRIVEILSRHSAVFQQIRISCYKS